MARPQESSSTFKVRVTHSRGNDDYDLASLAYTATPIPNTLSPPTIFPSSSLPQPRPSLLHSLLHDVDVMVEATKTKSLQAVAFLSPNGHNTPDYFSVRHVTTQLVELGLAKPLDTHPTLLDLLMKAMVVPEPEKKEVVFKKPHAPVTLNVRTSTT